MNRTTGLKTQNGSVILLALIAIILVGALAAATFNRTNFTEERSGQAKQKDKSELAADAALQMAIRNVQRIGSSEPIEDASNCSILDGPKPDQWEQSSAADFYSPSNKGSQRETNANQCINPPAPLTASFQDAKSGRDYPETNQGATVAEPLKKTGSKYDFGSYKGFLNGIDSSDGTYNYVVRGGAVDADKKIPAGYTSSDIQNGVCGWPGVPDRSPAGAPAELVPGTVRQITAYGYFGDKCAKRTLRFIIVPRAFRYAIYSNNSISTNSTASLLLPPAYKTPENSRGGDVGANGPVNFDIGTSVNQRIPGATGNWKLYDTNFKKEKVDYSASDPNPGSEDNINKYYSTTGSTYAPWGSLSSPSVSGTKQSILYGGGTNIRFNTPSNFPVVDDDTGKGVINFDGNIMDLASTTVLPQYDGADFVKKQYSDLSKQGQIFGGTADPTKGYRGISIPAEYFKCLLNTAEFATSEPTKTNCPGNFYNNKTLVPKNGDVSRDGTFLLDASAVNNSADAQAPASDGSDTGKVVLPKGMTIKSRQLTVGDAFYTDNANALACGPNPPAGSKCDVNGKKTSLPQMLYIDNRNDRDTVPAVESCNLDIKNIAFQVTGGMVVDGCDVTVGTNTSFRIKHLMEKESSITHTWPGLMVLEIPKFSGSVGGNVTFKGITDSTVERVSEIDGLLLANKALNVTSEARISDDQTRGTLNVNGSIIVGKGDTNISGGSALGNLKLDGKSTTVVRWNPLVQRTRFDVSPGKMGTYSIRTNDTPAPPVPQVSIDKAAGKVPPLQSTVDYVGPGDPSTGPIKWNIINDATNVRCYLRRDDQQAPKLTPCVGSTGFSTSGLEQGKNYTFRVVACNISGCGEDSYSWRIKPNLPSVQIVSKPPASQNRDIDSNFEWKVTGGALPDGQSSMKCQLKRNGAVVQAFANCGSFAAPVDGIITPNNTTKTYKDLSRGDYTFSVKVCNEENNLPETPQCSQADYNWTLLPLKVTLVWTQVPTDLQDNTDESTSKSQTFKFKVTGGDAPTSWACKDVNNSNANMTPCPGTPDANGEYTITRTFPTCDEQKVLIIASNDAGDTQLSDTFRVKCRRPEVRFLDALDKTDYSPAAFSSGTTAAFPGWKVVNDTKSDSGAENCKVTITANDAGLPANRVWYCGAVSGQQALGNGSWDGSTGNGSLGLGTYCNNVVYQLQVKNESGWSDPITIRMHRNCSAPTVGATYNGAIQRSDGLVYARWDWSVDWNSSPAGSMSCNSNRWGTATAGRCTLNTWWDGSDPRNKGLSPTAVTNSYGTQITEYFGSFTETSTYTIRAYNKDNSARACRVMSTNARSTSKSDTGSYAC